MKLTRRHTLTLAMGTAVAALLPLRATAAAEDNIAAFTGGAEVGSDGITLILAAGNPTPGVATFNFGPLAASQFASTRIRLAGTQDVVAVAKMPDGSFVQASQEVKVTIGGCGG